MGRIDDILKQRSGGSVVSAVKDFLGAGDEELVDFHTFLTDPQYLALDGIYPFWLEESKHDYADYSSVALTGSLAGGKSSYANMLTCYRLYRWFSQGDLHTYFGILRGSPIYFLYFSVSMKAAERSGF